MILFSSLVGVTVFFGLLVLAFCTGVSGTESGKFDDESLVDALAVSLLAGVALGGLSTGCIRNEKTRLSLLHTVG